MVQKKSGGLFGWLKAIGIALIIAILIKSFVFTNYIVNGPSMMPTLQNGNRLIVSKINYEFSKPKHGDIIIFHATPTEDYVKRVIGLPGDTIVYKNDQLYRNGKKIAEPYLEPYKKQLSGGKLTEDFTLKEKTGKLHVPDGKLWVMGDNRQVSKDSRDIGFIDMTQVVGKASIRYYPLSEVNILPGSK